MAGCCAVPRPRRREPTRRGSRRALSRSGRGRMRAVEPETDSGATGPFGSRFLGLGIGLATLVILVMLPFLIPVTFYVVANVYALVKGTTFSSATANTGVVLTLLVFSVVVFPVGLAVAIAYLGRALSPKRRRG